MSINILLDQAHSGFVESRDARLFQPKVEARTSCPSVLTRNKDVNAN